MASAPSVLDPQCARLGLVVDARRTIPQDPRIYQEHRCDDTPCNRLYCSACGSWVETVAGYGLKLPYWKVDTRHIEALYDGQAADESPVLTNRWAGRHSRVYYCRCSCYGVSERPRHLLTHGPDHWACAGHPQ